MNFLLFKTSKQQKLGLVFWIALLSLSYLVHQFVFDSTGIAQDSFSYSLVSLYLFFGVFSIVLMVIIFRVRSRNFDLLGMSFLIVTTIKMLICFLLVRPILKSTAVSASIEKTNFFVMFIVFLAIETVVTIRILNEKQ